MGIYRNWSAVLMAIPLLVGGCGQSASTNPSPQTTAPAASSLPVSVAASPSPVASPSASPGAESPTTLDYFPFIEVIPVLQAKTQIPILLPMNLKQQINLDAEPPLYAIVEAVTATAYTVQLAFDPDCQGQSACSLGSVSGEAIAPSSPAPEGQPTLLAEGIQGYFVDVNPDTCGSGYCYASMTWDWQGARYTLELKAPTREQLVALVNTAIANPISPAATSSSAAAIAPNPQPLTAQQQTVLVEVLTNASAQLVEGQTFQVTLNGFGRVIVAPVMTVTSSGPALSFELVQGDRIVYTLPPSEESSGGVPFFALDAVAFQDVNQDGLTDVIAVARYSPQPNAAQAVPGATVYLGDRSNRFTTDTALNQKLRDRGAKTVAEVRKIVAEQ